MDGSTFGVGDGYGRGGVGPRTTNMTSQKVDFWIVGGDFVSYKIRDYSPMSNSYKESYYYPSYLMWEYCHGSAGDGRGGVGPRTTNLSPQKYNFDIDRHDGGFNTSQ